ncbi:hypothetical protein IFT59_07300 [Rhizobium sp. CFBP 8752]|uniref:hypothetical protein n=1 Tax=Rhizobium sp. CFBP 8752 TaxID=2775301 RepID=UPI001786592C|nr:hypothetical protein [Rhizobium sp. CFBP 8752]MBD8663058.1 hypothetical protein [Rhizobium sp. CFBP 8752]
MTAKVQDSDIVEAAAEYLWSVCEPGKLAPLAVVRRADLGDADNGVLVTGVRDRLARFSNGARLTSHGSGDGYEAFRDPYRALLRDLIDGWQSGQIQGGTARLMSGARSYGDLYRLARDLDVQIRVKPADIAARIVSGDLTPAAGQAILGIEDSDEMKAFVEAWTM